jgi:hypothetical protein
MCGVGLFSIDYLSRPLSATDTSSSSNPINDATMAILVHYLRWHLTHTTKTAFTFNVMSICTWTVNSRTHTKSHPRPEAHNPPPKPWPNPFLTWRSRIERLSKHQHWAGILQTAATAAESFKHGVISRPYSRSPGNCAPVSVAVEAS